jgi:hypothetical protein
MVIDSRGNIHEGDGKFGNKPPNPVGEVDFDDIDENAKKWGEKSGTKVGYSSPWGKVQRVDRMAPGIGVVSTASHGGIKLSRERNAAMPDEFRQPGGWYEEDCEAAMPMWIFADDLGYDQERKDRVRGTIIRWFPDEYEALTGEIIPPGESNVKDERAFYQEHANDIVTYWALNNDDGSVRVGACRGGRGNSSPDKETYVYDLPKDVYEQRDQWGLVIDETQYQPIAVENKTLTKGVW